MRSSVLLAGVMALCLTACGGGGVASTPSPAPAPGPGGTPTPSPAPVNTSLDNLQSDQTFASNATGFNADWDVSSGLALNGSASKSQIKISFDATTQSYTVQSGSRSQTFGKADEIKDSQRGEARYQNADGSELLTLVTTTYTSKKQNKFVGMGYWQSSTLTGGKQATELDVFVYGFPAPANALPTAGGATFLVDAFGAVSQPGMEPRAFFGSDKLYLDLTSGLYSTRIPVFEYSLNSISNASGGYILSQGQVTSANGFEGSLLYQNVKPDTLERYNFTGSLTGGFYGPEAQELGATFLASSGNGAVVGALTGQRDTSPAVTLALTNILSDTDLRLHFAQSTIARDSGQSPALRGSVGYVNDIPRLITLMPDGSFRFPNFSTGGEPITFGNALRAKTQKANFDSYEYFQAPSADYSFASGTMYLDMFKRGSANNQIQLTYSSFGIWHFPVTNGTYSNDLRYFAVFGLETPKHVLAGRRGTASYDGVVYGINGTSDGNRDVTGASSFTVDFGSQKFSGYLDLNALLAGGGSTALGRWTFSDAMSEGLLVQTRLYKNGDGGVADLPYNSILPVFFGPNGEEIGATFSIQNGMPSDLGSTAITGVTVAKRN